MRALFPSRYPIVEAVMNQGSSLDLASAVVEAGAFPSLWVIKKLENGKDLDIDYAHDLLYEFTRRHGNANVLIGIGPPELFDDRVFDLVKKFCVSHIEFWGTADASGKVLDFDTVYSDIALQDRIKQYRTVSKIFTRISRPINSVHVGLFDGFCIKGQESAGTTGNWKIKDLFFEQQKLTPEIPLIPYGGIGHPSHVSEYITSGAVAVAVGTLFAATVESPLSLEAKQKIIQATTKNIVKDSYIGQNTLQLGESNDIKRHDYDWNRTQHLLSGMHGDGNQGLLYIGHGVDYIDRIRTVKETVDYLTGI